jgi:hypothetical protein
VLGRSRFADLVRRQLDLFENEEASLLTEAAQADDAWTHADRENSEELFGDYQLVVDAVAERLHDLRETYAASLDELTADEYRAGFNQAAVKRFRRYSGLLEDR